MSNRRLVPMPVRKVSVPPASGNASAAAPVPLADMKTWHAFAFLVATAIVMYFAMWPILIVAALVGFFRGMFYLCRRYPRTMFVILAIINGLMDGRRRR